jgi:hypothetical protein
VRSTRRPGGVGSLSFVATRFVSPPLPIPEL